MLLKYGFLQSAHDHYLFTCCDGQNFIVILVYVDNLVITGSSEVEICNIKKALDEKFTIKNMREARYFLGLEIKRTDDGIFVNQRKYILNILKDNGLIGVNSKSTPFPKGQNLYSRCVTGT